eukprot:TRINITY_DN7324_c0_g1_i1.p1 TRINITY_DN7324_c0_g1~~TRINITY_DN7324_c0_g1_i1.p1  ORF type:complete len:990 (-),score=267.00 TRINITY_DN7324_c0_g1_i1:50-3019(-)
MASLSAPHSLADEVGSMTLSRVPSGMILSDEPTVIQTLAVNVKKNINTIAVDHTGKFAALGGKKGLSILDLDEPYEQIKTLNQQSKWEISVVEWHPHKDRAHYIASAANQDTLIWNLNDERFELQCTLQTHQRAVSDLAWSLFDRNVLATCSADTYINLWDMRDPKKPIKKESFCGWTAGATQVKWNRHNQMTLASAHNGEVRVWDIRKVGNPLTMITAHMAKIYGIDWSYTNERELVTCSEDKQVKFWNTTNNRVCQATMQSGVPILRAKFAPFGQGLVTMAQRSDYTLRMWNLLDLSTPVKQFTGHTDVITAFDWRAKDVNGTREYQLVTWSKDQYLRMWHIDKATREAASSAVPSPQVGGSSKNGDEEAFRPSTPIERNSLTPYGIKNLQQELAALEKRCPQFLTVESVALANRQVVIVIDDLQDVKMKITFPSLYPNGAAPSFSFLPHNGGITTQNQAKIVESLSDTAIYHVECNRPCLFQCLHQLVEIVKEFSNEGKESADSIKRSMNIPNNNDEIPCPRLSGAVFSPTGKIFFFHNLKYTRNSYTRLRTYQDLKTFLSKPPTQDMRPTIGSEEPANFYSFFYSPLNYNMMNNISNSNLELQGSTDSMSLDPFESNTLSISPPTGTFNMTASGALRTSGTISLFGTNDNDYEDDIVMGETVGNHQQSATSQFINNSVYIKDVSYLMPQSIELAKSYTLTGSIEEVCEHNAEAAAVLDRKDLVQIWKTLKEVMSPLVYNPEEKETLGKTPWSYHPFGRPLLKSIFSHYERIKDVQSLAVISCVLELEPPSRYKASSTPVFPLIRQTSPVPTSKHNPRFFLLDPSEKEKYDKYRTQYAEILFRWQLLDKRSEILKFIKQLGYSNQSAKEELEFCSFCFKCMRPLSESASCTHCRDWGLNCAICHVSVRGSSNFCLVCGHGGHTKHILDWFETESTCPTGCGCACVSGAYKGDQHELVVRQIVQEKREESMSAKSASMTRGMLIHTH